MVQDAEQTAAWRGTAWRGTARRTVVWTIAALLAGLPLLTPISATEPVAFPSGTKMIDAVYSQRTDHVVLLFENQLLLYQTQTQEVSLIPLPEPALAVSELDGQLVVGAEKGVYLLDLMQGTLSRRLATPTPAHHLVLGPAHVFLLQTEGEDGIWKIPWDGGKRVFLPIRLNTNNSLERGPDGPVIFRKPGGSSSFVWPDFEVAGQSTQLGCEFRNFPDSSRAWFHDNEVFIETGHRYRFEPWNCTRGKRHDLEFSSRLPVVKMSALCVVPEYLAIVQDLHQVDPQRRWTAAEKKAPAGGIHVEVFSNPLPKRLATFPLPSLQDDGDPAWGRYVFCDPVERRLFVVLQNGHRGIGFGLWGLTTLDLTPIQDQIKRSQSWAELID